MYAIKYPSGKIDQYFVGETKNEVWMDRGFYLMCHLYRKDNWENMFFKRLDASKSDFKKKGFSIVKVKVVEETK